jgi:copper transport protein
VHITAACVWLGGLATLAVALVPSGATAGLDTALARFSVMAPACVVVLAATGTFHAVLRAGSAGLLTTGYGHAYWFKVAAVLAMLAVANGNRRYVSRHVRGRPDPGAAPLHLLGLFLGAEVAFGVLVIVLTGTLVDAPVA